MTATYDSRGRRVGATLVEITPNMVTQIKNTEKDGYNGVQLGYGTKKSVNKPQLGQGKKAGFETPIRWFKEVRTEEVSIEPGQQISVGQVFSIGDAVKVTGVSKGKGFQGGVRRHGFHGGPKTHGQSDRHRAPGSIGSGTTPGRVLKGKRMAGHMGAVQVSTRGLEVVGIDKEKNILTIKGAVPGHVGTLVTVIKMGRIKGYTSPPEEKPDEESEDQIKSDTSEASESVDQKEQSGSTDQTDTPISSDLSEGEKDGNS